MAKWGHVVLLGLCIVPPAGVAQVIVNGQAAVHVLKSARTTSPLVIDHGRPTFGWQSFLFADWNVTDDVTAFATLAASDAGEIGIDYLAIRMANLTPLELSLEVGKFALPFGNLAEHRFPRRNSLFGLPLIHTYRTALPHEATTESDVLAHRGEGVGVRLLNTGLYDMGAMLSGSVGIVEYAVAVTTGTISAPSYSQGNSNSDFGKIFRLAITPTTGLTFGGSYAWGAYLDEPYHVLPRNVDVNMYSQKTIEVDIEFSRGFATVSGEGVFNTWQVPLETRDEEFRVFGYTIEGKYTILPRLYAALRWSGLRFGDAVLGQISQPWDYDVAEWEGGLGYFLDRDVLIKLVRRETRIGGGTWPKDNLTVIQLVVAY